MYITCMVLNESSDYQANEYTHAGYHISILHSLRTAETIREKAILTIYVTWFWYRFVWWSVTRKIKCRGPHKMVVIRRCYWSNKEFVSISPGNGLTMNRPNSSALYASQIINKSIITSELKYSLLCLSMTFKHHQNTPMSTFKHVAW